jgi:hypothetical protein
MKPDESYFLLRHNEQDVRIRWVVSRFRDNSEAHTVFIDNYRGKTMSKRFDIEQIAPAVVAEQLCTEIDLGFA